MNRIQNKSIPSIVILALSMVLASNATADAQQDTPALRSTISQVPSSPAMTLPQIEQMAVQSNPTLAQAQSSIPAAEGRRRQAGLLPNPVLGGEVENFAFRALSIKPAYFGFGEFVVHLKRCKKHCAPCLELSAAAWKLRVQPAKPRPCKCSAFF